MENHSLKYQNRPSENNPEHQIRELVAIHKNKYYN